MHEMLGITNGRVRIDGEEKLELRVGFSTISVDQGAARLTK